MLDSLNEYTNNNYESLIGKVKSAIDYDICVLKGDYKSIKKRSELWDVHKNKPLDFRIKVFLKSHMKFVFSIYRKISTNF